MNEDLTKTKLFEEVFGSIAHQWRQPLSQINSIVGSIDNRLYEKGIEDPFLSEELLKIEKIIKQMSQSIDDYRRYLSDKNDTLTLENFIETIKDAVALKLEQSGIELHLQIIANAYFSVDKKLLKQLIITILDNARDALISRNVYEPSITLKTEIDKEFVIIRICDNAGGISKSVMQKMFDPNFTTKHDSEGTGLGLYMVKKLADEKLNASLEVFNVASGACFTLKLPKGEKNG